MGSYEILTPANVTGSGGMNILATFTALPIGIYILTGNIYITTSPFSSNIQFGVNGTTQNGNLQNLLSTTGTLASVVRITVVWFQTSAVNVFFSGSGSNSFENIAASYVRIG